MTEGLPAAVLVGYGSIGRYHMGVLAERYAAVGIVDPKPEARREASESYPAATVAPDLEALAASGWAWPATTAVIATWGPSHDAVFHELVRLGVRRVLCEKPLAHSVAAGDRMVATAQHQGVALGLHMQLRYNGLTSGLRQLAEEHQLGEPQALLVHGGANCLVTNGIHYLDFGVELLGGDMPLWTTSTASGDPINPRSPDLRFYGGTAVWEFTGGRRITLAMSNESSVAEQLVIYYRHGRAVLSRLFDLELTRRSPDEVAKWEGRITRTGEPSEVLFRGKVPGLAEGTLPTIRVLDEVDRGQSPRLTPETARDVLEACIASLISARDRRALDLPLSADDLDRITEWPIS